MNVSSLSLLSPQSGNFTSIKGKTPNISFYKSPPCQTADVTSSKQMFFALNATLIIYLTISCVVARNVFRIGERTVSRLQVSKIARTQVNE